jgi:hypothetical protein
MIFIRIAGIGPDADRDELNTIAKASGNGGASPEGDIILQAIGSRSGA